MHNEKDEILLHDYFDNLLSSDEQQHFEEYIVDHIELAIDLGRLKNLRRNLKNMPSNFTPPDAVIENIISSLLGNKESIDTFALQPEDVYRESENKDKIKKKKVRKKLKPKTKYKLKQSFKIAIFFVVLLLMGYVYYYKVQNDKTTPWIVKTMQNIDSLQTEESYLTINSTLLTKTEQKAIISIAQKATLELSDNAQIKVINATQGLNSIDYKSGDILFKPIYDNEIFEIIHNKLSLFSSNSEFLIDSHESRLFVEVITNFITIKSKLLEYRIPLNYKFELLGENKISIPISNNSSNYFHQLIKSYTNLPSEHFLDKIVEVSGLDEAFTLHFLLAQVTPAYRELIIDKLNKISPMPSSCSKEKILILDSKALDDWWETIFIAVS